MNTFHIESKRVTAKTGAPASEIVLNDVGTEDCPDWVGEMLSMPTKSVKKLEIVCEKKWGQNDLYLVLQDYMYHRGVDVDEDIPSISAASTAVKEDSSVEEDFPVVAPCQEESSVSSDTAVDSSREESLVNETENISLCNSRDPDLLEDTYEDELLVAWEQVDGLNERESTGVLSTITGDVGPRQPRPCSPGNHEPVDRSAAKYSFGLGYAKAMHDGNIIIVRHLSRGGYGENRVLVLYAKTSEILKLFGKHVKAWHFERYKPPPKRRSYSLYVLIGESPGKVRWSMTGRKDSRSLDSVVLREGQLQSIIADFKSFQSKATRKWYRDHGLPHRRSFLFYGPPGVGKTSTIKAIAGELDLKACFLSLSDNHFQNKSLHQAITNLPRPAMLVMEDIDVLFNESRKSETHSLVTFSGLLNALDGLISADGVLTVMTTNHPERLDPALTRAGRVDRRFEFKAPDRVQMKNYFLTFYPGADEAVAKKFAEKVFARPEKEARSIATVQEHFIYTRGSTAEESVAKVDEFFEEFYPDGGKESTLSYTM